jgi:hypothetical protein
MIIKCRGSTALASQERKGSLECGRSELWDGCVAFDGWPLAFVSLQEYASRR